MNKLPSWKTWVTAERLNFADCREMRFGHDTDVVVKSGAGLYNLLVFLVFSSSHIDGGDVELVDVDGTIGATI